MNSMELEKSPPRKPFLLPAFAVGEGNQLDAVFQLGAAEEILVPVGHGAQSLVRRQQLDVGLHHGRVTANQLHFFYLLRDDPVEHLVERRAGC